MLSKLGRREGAMIPMGCYRLDLFRYVDKFCGWKKKTPHFLKNGVKINVQPLNLTANLTSLPFFLNLATRNQYSLLILHDYHHLDCFASGKAGQGEQNRIWMSELQKIRVWKEKVDSHVLKRRSRFEICENG